MSPYVNYSNWRFLSAASAYCRKRACATTLSMRLTARETRLLLPPRGHGRSIACLLDYKLGLQRRLGSNKSDLLHSARRNSSIMGYEPDHVTIKPADKSDRLFAQPCGALSYYSVAVRAEGRSANWRSHPKLRWLRRLLFQRPPVRSRLRSCNS